VNLPESPGEQTGHQGNSPAGSGGDEVVAAGREVLHLEGAPGVVDGEGPAFEISRAAEAGVFRLARFPRRHHHERVARHRDTGLIDDHAADAAASPKLEAHIGRAGGARRAVRARDNPGATPTG
jgi:hypothetical protein